MEFRQHNISALPDVAYLDVLGYLHLFWNKYTSSHECCRLNAKMFLNSSSNHIGILQGIRAHPRAVANPDFLRSREQLMSWHNAE